VSSLCSFFPEYALWIISGINKNLNISNIELAKIFNLPLIVVITHLDKLDEEEEIDTVVRVKKTLKTLYPNKAASVIK
jgi:GTPase